MLQSGRQLQVDVRHLDQVFVAQDADEEDELPPVMGVDQLQVGCKYPREVYHPSPDNQPHDNSRLLFYSGNSPLSSCSLYLM